MANEKNVLGTAESTEVFNDYEFSPVPDERKIRGNLRFLYGWELAFA